MAVILKFDPILFGTGLRLGLRLALFGGFTAGQGVMVGGMGPYLETDFVGEDVDESEDGGGGDVGGELLEDRIFGLHANLANSYYVFDYMLY